MIGSYAFIGLTLYQIVSLTFASLLFTCHGPENIGTLIPFSSCRVRPALPGHPDSLLSGQPVFCRTAPSASYGYHLWIMGRSVSLICFYSPDIARCGYRSEPAVQASECFGSSYIGDASYLLFSFWLLLGSSGCFPCL